jgi:hypothetical protein
VPGALFASTNWRVKKKNQGMNSSLTNTTGKTWFVIWIIKETSGGW